MNKVVLIGRITKDIEVKNTSSGMAVAAFSLAVNRDYKNAEGKYDADFINCVAFKQNAETISKYVHKGDKFCVIGKISTRNYDDSNGKKVYVTEVIVDGFEFLEPKKNDDSVNISAGDYVEIKEADEGLPF